MTLNKGSVLRKERRRQLVASLLLREPGITQRQIQDRLEQLDFLNPRTDLPYSIATVNTDIKALRQLWRENATRDITSHQSRILASLREAEKAAWEKSNIGLVLKSLKQQSDLLGTGSPVQVEIWQKEVESRGLDASTIFEHLVEEAVAALTASDDGTDE